MNIFFVFRDKVTGKPEIATAPLTRGDILPGVTRDSILQLARQWPDVTVNERWVTMKEVIEAQKNGTVSPLHPSRSPLTALLAADRGLRSRNSRRGLTSALHRLQRRGHPHPHRGRRRANRPTRVEFADGHPVRQGAAPLVGAHHSLDSPVRPASPR